MLIPLAVWVHPVLSQLALSPPEAVRPPAALRPAALRVEPSDVWQPRTESWRCDIKRYSSAASAIYTPGPSVEELEKTPTARGDRRSGRVRVRYCFNESGTVESAMVVRHFPEDPEIDEAAPGFLDRRR